MLTVDEFEKLNGFDSGSIRNPNGTCPTKKTLIETMKLKYKLILKKNEKSKKTN